MNATSLSYYMFVANDVKLGHTTIQSSEAIQLRLAKGYWIVGEGKAVKSTLRPNDKIVFYAAGSAHGVFIATATIASEQISPTAREKADLEPEFDYVFGFSYGVKLKEPLLFPRPVTAKDLLNELSFTRRIKRWGVYFRTAVRRIEERDYHLILGMSGLSIAE